MEQYRGVVVRKPYAVGSKSERIAVCLQPDSKDAQPAATLLLRRAGGNPFADDQLEALVGSRVEMTGTRRGDLLIVTSWTKL